MLCALNKSRIKTILNKPRNGVFVTGSAATIPWGDVKQPITKEYASLQKTLVYTPNTQMMDQEAWHAGEGSWVQIAVAV